MIFAILGPNGAGTTALLRMLENLTSADAGTATVKGRFYSNRASEGAGLADMTLVVATLGCSVRDCTTFIANVAAGPVMGMKTRSARSLAIAEQDSTY